MQQLFFQVFARLLNLIVTKHIMFFYQFLLKRVKLASHIAIPMVLDIIISSAFQIFANNSPLVAIKPMQKKQ